MIKVSPSILSADFANLQREIESVSSADYLHIDVMDGHFVPNITVGIPVVKSIRSATDMFLDVHLMISEPQKYSRLFCEAGADLVTVHLESCNNGDLDKAIQDIKDCGKKVGISIKPNTPGESLIPYLEAADMFLVMTVEPGFGGQRFMYEMADKISSLRKLTDKDIEVDGGINADTARICVEAGANVLVAGSYIFKSNNRKELISGLLSI